MKNSILPFHRLSASITSWFRSPEQGMLNHEMLCRGTAFATRFGGGSSSSKSKGRSKSNLYFITCSHVAAPPRWPKLYPMPWLKHVDEQHIRCLLHVTEGKTGRVLDYLPMKRAAIHHDVLDVCVMQLEDEEDGLRRMEKHGLKLEAVEMAEEEVLPIAGQQVVSCGFAVSRGEEKEAGGSSQEEEEEEEEEELYESIEISDDGVMTLALETDREPRRMCVSMGSVNQYKDRLSRGFARMDQVLLDGMCGAPVLDLKTSKCIGMIEGVVPGEVDGGRTGPEAEVRRAIAGNAGFIYAQEIRKLLCDKAAEKQ